MKSKFRTVKSIFKVYLITVTTYVLASLVSLFLALTQPQLSKVFGYQFEKLVKTILATGNVPLALFLKNFVIATGMSIPFIGIAMYFLSLSVTGSTLSFYVVYKCLKLHNLANVLPMYILALTSTILFPHAILEFLAFSIAMYNSWTTSKNLVKLSKGSSDLRVIDIVKFWLIMYLLSAILLIIAAHVEYLTIKFLSI